MTETVESVMSTIKKVGIVAFVILGLLFIFKFLWKRVGIPFCLIALLKQWALFSNQDFANRISCIYMIGSWLFVSYIFSLIFVKKGE